MDSEAEAPLVDDRRDALVAALGAALATVSSNPMSYPA